MTTRLLPEAVQRVVRTCPPFVPKCLNLCLYTTNGVDAMRKMEPCFGTPPHGKHSKNNDDSCQDKNVITKTTRRSRDNCLLVLKPRQITLGYLAVVCPKHGNKEVSMNANGCSMFRVVAKPTPAGAVGGRDRSTFLWGGRGSFA